LRGSKRLHALRVISFLAVLVAACGDGKAPAVVGGHKTVLPPLPTEEAWAPAEGKVLARSGALEVLDSAARAVQRSGEEMDPARALDRAASLEAVSAHALGEGGEDLRLAAAPRYRQALVQRLLTLVLEEKLTPATAPEEYLKQAWSTKKIRRKYVHYDSFFVSDLQHICCRDHASICIRDHEDFGECFARGEEKMKAAMAMLRAASPADGDAFEAAALDAKEKIGASITYQTFSFYHDAQRSYEENVNVVRMSKPVTVATLALKMGQQSGIVRDHFGLHIIFLKDHIPEENRSLDEEAVRLEIAEGALPAIRKAEFSVLISRAVRDRKVEVFEDRLEALRAR
jgi:hypothetical protein